MANMLDAMVEAAAAWPDRCEEIGFDDRQTHRLGDMLRTRLDSLK